MNLEDDLDYQLIKSQYGRIGRMLQLLWGSSTFNDYVDNLMHDTRDGKRQGFPQEIAVALLGLQMTHNRLFTKFNKPDNPTSGWFTYG